MATAALAYALTAIGAAAFEWPGAPTVDAQELSSLDHGQRQRAAERLSTDGGAQARAGLISLLDDPAPSVRVAAARILVRQGAPEAIDTATRWTISPTPANRRLGLEVLRESPGALPPAGLRAVERSLSDADATVRLLGIDTLARQPDLAASLLPIAAASEDENREVRLRAVRLLAASHDRRAVVPLLARLPDQDRQVRVEAIEALALIGDVGAAPALKRQLADPADEVRIAAALALGKLAIADAVTPIAALARRRNADEVARQAALALGDIATPEAIAVLVGRLREPPVAEEVTAGLRRAGPAAIPALIAEAERGTESTSAAAATLLGQLRAGAGGQDRRVSLALAQVVQRRGAAGRAAMTALGAIRDPETVPLLLDAARDPLAETRRAGYQALLAIGDDRALVILERGLGDADAQVRALALRMGAHLRAGTPAALAAMAARLGDADARVGHEAAAALLELGRPMAGTVPALLALLARAPADVAVASALELLATPGDDRALSDAAARLPGEGRRAVARALAAAHVGQPLTDDRLVGRLLAMLSEGGASAEAAADALGVARAGRDQDGRVLRAFEVAEPDVRARLCAALAAAGGAAGRERLVALVSDAGERPDVRAAAAWSLATTQEPPRAPARDQVGRMAASSAAAATGSAATSATALQAVLARAAASDDAALAANARAALTRLARGDGHADVGQSAAPRATWVAVRLLTADGGARPHEWVALTAASGAVVWTRSGLDGVARVGGLPPGPYRVRMIDPALNARLGDPESQRSP